MCRPDEQARQLLEEMTRAGAAPELEHYSAALRAAASAGDARSADRVYLLMHKASPPVQPDAATAGSLLAALRKGGASSKAAQYADKFRRDGVMTRASNGGR